MKKTKNVDFSQVAKIDLAGVSSTDSSGIAFLDELYNKISLFNKDVLFINHSTKIKKAMQTFSSLRIQVFESVRPQSFFESFGENVYSALVRFFYGLVLSSDIFYWAIVGITNRKHQRKGSLSLQSLLIGAEALPILLLLSLIIGLIIALQSAAQLKRFGANIFIADLIAISMVREMGPMMTAIIIAGRSGSAIAAEIATMKITEEIDALKVMAINPLRYVVVPKFHAITICMPLLVAFSIFVGIFGGLVVATGYLDLSPVSYASGVINSLEASDFIVSFIKSVVFAWLIVFIAAYYGFNVTGGAEGVGKATTESVVASIFAVIVMDAVFSFLFLPK
ncbi:MAG: ABC transporter permease [Candidatus Cloacimonetes bacterium]|nr:ABC transporter permease [Candidatus Cloacimonadota bacterium]